VELAVANRKQAGLRIAVVALSATAFLLAIVSSAPYGIGVSPDSLNYLAAGQAFSEGQGYRSVNGDLMAFWPPLYSLVLAIGPSTGIPVLSFARWLHALLAAATAFSLGWLLIGRVRWWPLAAAAVALAVTAQPMITIQSFAWSEPLFNLITLGTLAVLSRYLVGGDRRDLGWTILGIGLACMARYPGVVLIPVAMMGIVALGQGSRRRRVGECALVGVAASAPISLWLIRNAVITGTLAGPRIASKTSLLESLQQTCRTLNSWLLPGDLLRLTERSGWLAACVAVTVVAGFSAVILAALLRRTECEGMETGTSRQRSFSAFRPGFSEPVPVSSQARRELLCRMLPPALFLGGYFVFMLAFASLTAIDRMGSRLLSPLVLPALWMLALALDRLLDGLPTGRPLAAGRTCAGVALIVLLVLVGDQGKKRLLHLAREGQGFTSRSWRQQSLVADVAAIPRQTPLWTSHPLLLECLADRPSWRSPLQSIASRPPTGQPAPLPAPGETVFLAWFQDEYPSQPLLQTPRQLQAAFELVPWVVRHDGTIYRLRARNTPSQTAERPPKGSSLAPAQCQRPQPGSDGRIASRDSG